MSVLQPRLSLDFLTPALDSRVAFTRAGATATRINANGVVESVAADTPRFDYNPTTLALRGLLVEPARTNLLPRSIPDAGVPTGWSVLSNTGTFTHTLVSGFGPLSGFQNVIQHDQSVSGRSPLTIGLTLAANTTYTLSVYIDKANSSITSGSTTILSVSNFSGATGTLSKTLSQIPTDNYVSITFTTSTDVTGDIRIGVGCSANATGTIVFGGWQLEEGTSSTSYIPTEATAVTRNADVATITGTNFSDFWQASKGGVMVRARPGTVSGTRPWVQFDDNTADNIIALRGNTTNPELYIVDGGTPQAQIDAGTIAANTDYSMTAWWQTDGCKARLNNGAVATDTSATIPTVTQMRIGSDGTNYLNGHLASISYYDTFSDQIYTRRKNKAVFSLL